MQKKDVIVKSEEKGNQEEIVKKQGKEKKDEMVKNDEMKKANKKAQSKEDDEKANKEEGSVGTKRKYDNSSESPPEGVCYTCWRQKKLGKPGGPRHTLDEGCCALKCTQFDASKYLKYFN